MANRVRRSQPAGTVANTTFTSSFGNDPLDGEDGSPIDVDSRNGTALSRALGAAVKAITAGNAQTLKSLVGGRSDIPVDYVGPLPMPQSLTSMGLVAPKTSLMHLAVRVGQRDCVAVLVQAGAPVGVLDSRGDTPLFLALQHCPDATEMMLRDGKGRNLRYVHRRTGRSILHEIVACAAPAKHARWQRMPLLQYLVVEYGVNAKERDASGLTPLEHAQNNYLQLGQEADDIIVFLEEPPKPQSQASLAQGRKFWECAKHPVCRFLLPVVLATTHVVMYLIDTVARGTAFPELLLANSSLGNGSGSMMSNDTMPAMGYADVYIGYPRRAVDMHQRFVAYGRRADVASLPFFFDIYHHLAMEWPTGSSGIAGKVLTILVGAIIGAVFFATVVHVVLRDLLRLRMFGAEVPYRAEETIQFTNLDDADGPRAAASQDDYSGGANPLSGAKHTSKYQHADAAPVAEERAEGVADRGPSCWDLVKSASPLVTASRGRGRLVLAFYGACVGVYCGGLVFNAMLDYDVMSYSAAERHRYRMKSTLYYYDGTPVHLCELWVVRFGICAMLAPLVYVVMIDEMFQCLSLQQFVPSTWFARWGMSSVQLWWSHMRLPFSALLLLPLWGLVLFLFIQDGIIFSFDDLGSTLIPSPHLAINLAVGGVALLLDVCVMLQSWSFPEMQSLVIIARPHQRKATDAVPMQILAGDSRVEVLLDPTDPKNAKRQRLLAGVSQDEVKGGQVKLKGKDREAARQRAKASQRTAGPDEFAVVEVRNAFKVSFTFMRGNIHWLLWFLINVDLVLDIGYVVFYIREVFTTTAMYPSNRDATAQVSLRDRLHSPHDGNASDVVAVSFALLPAAIATLLLLWNILKNSVWIVSCRKDFVHRVTPAIHEETEEVLITALPWTNENVKIGGVFSRKTVQLLQNNGGNAGGRESEAAADNGRNTAYDDAGVNSVVNVWACAYRDDVVRLGALLDAQHQLINERGGVGIRIRSRAERAEEYAAETMWMPGGNWGEDSAPPFVDLDESTGRGTSSRAQVQHTPRVAVVTGINDRTAELLPEGSDDPALYGATPLHYAILGGSRSAVMALLSRGANTRLRTMNGLCGAEELATISQNEQIIRLFSGGGGGSNATYR